MYIGRLSVIMAGLVLAGCNGTNIVDVEGERWGVSMPELELAVAADNDDTKALHRSYPAFVAGYTQGEGQFSQQIPSGKYANIDETQIDGPATLDSDASVALYYLRYNWRSQMDSHAEMFWGVGASYWEMDYIGETGGQQLEVMDSGAGPHGVFGLRLHFNDVFSLEGSISAFGWPLPFPEIRYLEDDRLLLNYMPNSRVRLFVGYRALRYTYVQESVFGEDSAIRFSFYGPTAGISLLF